MSRSSGTTAIATTTAGNTALLTPGVGDTFNRLVVTNEGGVAGFVSVDGGNTWHRLAATGQTILAERFSGTVYVKRDGGTNLTGLYASAYSLDVRG